MRLSSILRGSLRKSDVSDLRTLNLPISETSEIGGAHLRMRARVHFVMPATNVITTLGEVDHPLCYFQRRSSKGRMMGKSWAAVAAAAAAIISVGPAFAEMQTLTHNIRFCPTWAEAHERTLASLNNGRPPYRVRWKGCIELKRGTKVEIVKQDDEGTEIVLRGKNWFADE